MDRELLAKVIRTAKDRVSDPERWCRNFAAIDSQGKSCNNANDPNAVRWCAFGSLLRSSRELELNELDEATAEHILDEIATSMGFSNSMVDLNDRGTHGDVMRMFDAALARLEG